MPQSNGGRDREVLKRALANLRLPGNTLSLAARGCDGFTRDGEPVSSVILVSAWPVPLKAPALLAD